MVYVNNNGLDTNDNVFGEVALLRDRLDLAVENEEIFFVREYWDSDAQEWVVDGGNESYTNEQGIASFDWALQARLVAVRTMCRRLENQGILSMALHSLQNQVIT